MGKPLADAALDQVFRTARTRRGWTGEDTPEVLIRATYDLLKLAPTASNICPARFMFVRSEEAKARLEPHLDEGNRKQTMAAPYTAIIAYDLAFVDQLPKLIPHAPNAKDWFADPANAEWNAIQSGTLQGAYLILAARSLGLDCGPMGGFSRAGVDGEFFASDPIMKSWRSNFLVNIGHGDDTRLRARAPRLEFDEACRIL
ncbi:MAG: malonic semialdehyde reductase [Hyphomonadaceae bacterium]|nr:malonic semialdehyde reductase [Hyphomonadaceae bacterium]